MRSLFLLLLMLCGCSLFGQVVQYGRVVTLDPQGDPLPGTTITIPTEHDCQPTLSDSHGDFRLCFGEHHTGDVIQGLEAKKHGYEVVNVHVTRSWTLTTEDTLCIVMAPRNKVKEARMRYYALSGWCVNDLLGMTDADPLIEVESPVFSFHISRYSKGVAPSDVDLDIPEVLAVNDNTFVVIIANEDYDLEPEVPYSIHDGDIFKEYCVKALGIPESNIHMVANATLNNMRYEVEWLKGALEAYGGEGKGMFYYSGHGIPDEMTRNSYLLPVDGYGSNVASAYGLDALYDDLGSVEATSMLYFIDACFSGSTRDGGMIAEGRGVTIQAKEGEVKGKALAFTAAQGNETAYAYPEKSHGLFTYFLLKKLQESNGDLTAGELADYISDQVARISNMTQTKGQHPSVVSSEDLGKWREIIIK